MSDERDTDFELTDSQADYEKERKAERTRRRRNKKLHNWLDKIKQIEPKTKNQEQLFHSFYSEKHILLHGCAGTGKSYCALFLALQDLLDGRYERIIILRSIVPTRDVGFLPGTLQEKISMYEEPYSEIVDDVLNRKGAYEELKRDEVLCFKSTSFLRGVTWANSLIIADEIQNYTWHELCSLITRVGDGSRLMLLGDRDQNDLGHQRKIEQSGLESAIRVCDNMISFDVVEFGVQDVLRSELVREFLTAKKLLGL
jgi:phosphate starvation-inducible PhoH-like protein